MSAKRTLLPDSGKTPYNAASTTPLSGAFAHSGKS
jgi:hypothetical protein